ncbi:energy transducer TonB [Mesorhizobium sp. M1B.F.Ca.ET.045.04.1.1]|uniref:energy transducer TonB family protein n=1 Tax=Mesorhizobium sp. M1B.F.Ca.ET.045.04.1.1 TaxID=2493673 RepID=UPI000F75BA29|nr:energy transducer TonB [Mesorhizobium sp. M1B.F.Ca.ET.045.04.1.1]AZO32526.1 energy transducer TonB [Mesorhizobium sp. M1B.F.Ca.ET.045.04.1.1]
MRVALTVGVYCALAAVLPSYAAKQTPSAEDMAAFTRQVEGCWDFDTPWHKTSVKFSLNPDGSLDGVPEVVKASPGDDGLEAAKSAVRSVQECAPYPDAASKGLREVVIDFDPLDLFGGKNAAAQPGAPAKEATSAKVSIPFVDKRFGCSCPLRDADQANENCSTTEWNEIDVTIANSELTSLLDDKKVIPLLDELTSELVRFCHAHVPDFTNTGEYGVSINGCVGATKLSGGPWSPVENCLRERLKDEAVDEQQARRFRNLK